MSQTQTLIEQTAAAEHVLGTWGDELDGYTLQDCRLSWGGNASTVLVDIFSVDRWAFSFVVDVAEYRDVHGRVGKVGFEVRRVAVPERAWRS